MPRATPAKLKPVESASRYWIWGVGERHGQGRMRDLEIRNRAAAGRLTPVRDQMTGGL